MNTQTEYDPIIALLDIIGTIGYMITVDDIDDYGKFDRLHHWIIGEIIRLSSILAGIARVAQIIGED